MRFPILLSLCLAAALGGCVGTTFEAESQDGAASASGWIGCPFGHICKGDVLEVRTGDGRFCEGHGFARHNRPADHRARCDDGSLWTMEVPRVHFRSSVSATLEGRPATVTYY